MSKHESRFKDKISNTLRNKIDDYLNVLKTFSKELSSLKIDIEYGFDEYKELKLDVFSRAYIKKLGLENLKLDPNKIHSEWFYEQAAEIKDLSNFPRYFLGIYYARKDLQDAFNLNNTSNQKAYFQWIGNEIALGNLSNQLFPLLQKKLLMITLSFFLEILYSFF